MTTEYKILVYDLAGTLIAQVTDFVDLAYTKAVNRSGVLQFALSGEHSILTPSTQPAVLSALVGLQIIEVHRKISGYEWAKDFVGIYEDDTWTFDEKSNFLGTCKGVLEFLNWRHILWYADTINRDKFLGVSAETIMKTLVEYNAGASATIVNGRLRDGTMNIITATDLAAGNAIDFYCAWDNLLETLQKISNIGGGDFDIRQLITGEWQFQFYPGQLGIDRTASVIFSLQRGNMGNPAFRKNRSDSRTVALVAGQGEQTARQTALRTGPDYLGSSLDRELFVDARDIDWDNTDALEDRGDQKLDEVRIQEEFNFQILQTPATQYGVDYFLGDLVTAVNPFSGESSVVKVEAVSISFDRDGKENIEIQTQLN